MTAREQVKMKEGERDGRRRRKKYINKRNSNDKTRDEPPKTLPEKCPPKIEALKLLFFYSA